MALKLTLFMIAFAFIASVVAVIYQSKAYRHQLMIDQTKDQFEEMERVQRGLIELLISSQAQKVSTNNFSTLNTKCQMIIGPQLRSAYKMGNYIKRGLEVSYP